MKPFYETTAILEKNKNGNLKTSPNFTRPRKIFTNNFYKRSNSTFRGGFRNHCHAIYYKYEVFSGDSSRNTSHNGFSGEVLLSQLPKIICTSQPPTKLHWFSNRVRLATGRPDGRARLDACAWCCACPRGVAGAAALAAVPTCGDRVR